MILRRDMVLAIVMAVVSVAVIALGVWWWLSDHTGHRSVDPVVEQDRAQYAQLIATEKTYSTLPEAERDTFMQYEANRLGVDPRLEVTPEVLTIQCIDLYTSRLYKMSRQYKDKIAEYQDALNHTQMQIRDTCYANYDPDGKMLPEEMPHMQQH